MNRKLLFFAITVLFLLTYLFVSIYLDKENLTCPNCNVIVIDIDHLRADAITCEDEGKDITPNLCKFVERSVNFKHNISHHYWTLPSVASTLTSLYPSGHRVLYAYRDSIPENIPTLTDLLKKRDYKTAFIGPEEPDVLYLPSGYQRNVDLRLNIAHNNWLGVLEKLERDKDPFFVYFYSSYMHIPYILPSGVDLLGEISPAEDFPTTRQDLEEIVGNYLVENYKDIFTEDTISDNPDIFNTFREDNARNLLDYYYSFNFPNDKVTAPWHVEYAAFMEYLDFNVKGNDSATEYMKLLYKTKLNLMDHSLGSFLDKLQSKDLNGNTVVVIMSDHGDEFTEHGKFAHYQSIYNEVINTPLIFFAPGLSSRKVLDVTQNIDILPTILDITKIPIPEKVQGQSLVNLMVGVEGEVDRYAISELTEVDASIQNDTWKLIAFNYVDDSPTLELYNLENDPLEQTNIINQDRIVAISLLFQLRSVMEESRNLNSDQPSDFPDWIDEEMRERLIERGYF